MAATTLRQIHTHRPWHPHGSTHGDTSYSPMIMEKPRRAEGFARASSDTATWASATTRDSALRTSHFRPHSPAQVPAAPAPSPPSTADSSPREAPAPLYSTNRTASPASLRAVMNFSHTNATSMWGSSGPWSSSSSSSSPASSCVRYAEREPQRQRPMYATAAGESERKEEEERSAEEEPEEPSTIALRAPLVNSLRPSQPIRPRAGLSPEESRVDTRAHLVTLMDRVLSAPSLSDTRSQRPGYRERRESWSPEDTRPRLPPFAEFRSAFAEFVEGSSRPSFASTRGGDTSSPPPSPSPSASSFSTNDRSADTEPTDEDDVQPVKREHDSLELPPIRTLHEWRHPMAWNAASDRATHSPVLRPIVSPVRRLAAASPSSSSASASASASPNLPFHHVALHADKYPHAVSDMRSRDPLRAIELPPPLLAHPMWTPLEEGVKERGRPALPHHPRPVPAAQHGEPEMLSPTPRKFRFVASKPQIIGAAMYEEGAADSDRSLSSPAGTKRRFSDASATSSEEIPLSRAPSHAPGCGNEEDGARKRRPPFDVGWFSANPVVNSIRAQRGMRGAIVPEYHYDTERALKCAFPACGAVLSGKKSETASHMRSHFLQASGKTLHCPWPVETEDGKHVRCGMAFKESANFGRHVSSKHIKAEEYQCNRCGRPFARRDAALRHMKTLCRIDRPEGAKRGGGRKKKAKTTEEEEDDYMFED